MSNFQLLLKNINIFKQLMLNSLIFYDLFFLNFFIINLK